MANVDNTNAQMLSLGTPLQGGKYVIARYLASGGFGNTYIADNTALETQVVVKEFYLRGVSTRHGNGRSVSVSLQENRPIWEKMLDKFKREAQHMYKINHPNIVRVHDFFEENGTAYYVMDLVEGRSLRDIVADNGPLPERQVADMVPQLLGALERIHRDNIYHLDLKPANVMMERGGVVRLIDFGASKQNTAETGMTISSLAYTPAYAAPEQTLQNFKSIGPWSDLYSLGATVYYLLTRQDPPSQMDIDDDGMAAFNWQAYNVSPAMRQFVAALMQPRRNNRPQSVEQTRELFASLMRGGSQPTSQPQQTAYPGTNLPKKEKAETRKSLSEQIRERKAAEEEQKKRRQTPTSATPVVKKEAEPEISEAEALRRRINASRQKQQKKSKAPLILALIAVAALVMGLGYYFLSNYNNETSNSTTSDCEAAAEATYYTESDNNATNDVSKAENTDSITASTKEIEPVKNDMKADLQKKPKTATNYNKSKYNSPKPQNGYYPQNAMPSQSNPELKNRDINKPRCK